MIPLQDIVFRLKSGEAIFTQLISTGSGGFAATVTEPYQPSEIPAVKYFRWLPCPSGSDAALAFKEVVLAISNYASKDPNNGIASVENPCNCEFVTAAFQQDVVGSKVKVMVNGAVWSNA